MLGPASQAVQCLKAKGSFYIELGCGYCAHYSMHTAIMISCCEVLIDLTVEGSLLVWSCSHV